MKPSPLALAVLAYAWWGLVPAYWKQVPSFTAEELILYRVVLSFLSLVPVVIYRKEFSRILAIFRSPSSSFGCLIASVLIGFNWYLYIWAIAHNRVVESSLGYFLNPLVNMALGTLLLREKMNRAQKIACAFAALGTSLLAWQSGQVPWVALLLALSFGLYGFTRKVMQFPTLAATFTETIVLLPATFVGLYWLGSRGGLHGSTAPTREIAWALLSGLVTTIPLLAFAEAAKHLPLSFLGFLQFFTPSVQFMLGVFVYREPFGAERWVPFGVIWAGLLLFLYDSGRRAGINARIFRRARK